MFATQLQTIKDYLETVCYGGLNSSLVSQGGKECAEYLTSEQKLRETIISTLIMIFSGIVAWKTICLPKVYPKDRNPLGQRCLLLALAVIFGVEIGYKIASRKLLFFLNPCHILTVIQLVLLASKPNRFSFGLLRIMLHYVYGAFIAIFLAHMEGRYFYGEFISFFLHHICIAFIVPPYLVYNWGPESLEPFLNLGWVGVTGIFFGIQHHYVLQPLAMLTHVNLNYMLCPAERDPFNGPNYRFAAIFHQAFSLIVFGKLYSVIIRYIIVPLLPKINYFQEKTEGNHVKTD